MNMYFSNFDMLNFGGQNQAFNCEFPFILVKTSLANDPCGNSCTQNVQLSWMFLCSACSVFYQRLGLLWKFLITIHKCPQNLHMGANIQAVTPIKYKLCPYVVS